MKRSALPLSTSMISAVTACLIGFSSVMCLHDAFALSVPQVPLLLGCTALALLSSALFRSRRAYPSLLGAACSFGILLWQFSALRQGFLFFLHRLTSEYALCYEGVPLLGIPDGNALWFLLALALPISWTTAWVISRGSSVWLVLAVCMPILVPCLIIVDLAPVFWLIIWTGAILILVFSQAIRTRNPGQGGQVAWWAMLPVMILISAITVFWPPADYVRSDWSAMLQRLAEEQVRLETWTEEVAAKRPHWNRTLRRVDLSHLGPRTLTGKPVLRCAYTGDHLYLRGVSLGIYEKNSWEALNSSHFVPLGADSSLFSWGSPAYTVEIETPSPSALLYTPYYLSAIPAEGGLVDDAYLQNGGRLTTYTVPYGPRQTEPSPGYQDLVYGQYLQVPVELRPRLEALLKQAGLSSSTAEEIGTFVRSRCAYDLNTPAVPNGEDFILYFLETARQGYCVHFASSTVLLLRTAGIPARYVTGYLLTEPGNGQWQQVTEDQDHAWVEYYVSGQGWQLLDPTPPAQTPAAPAPDHEPEQPGGNVPPPTEPPAPHPEDSNPSPGSTGPAHPANPAPEQRLFPFWLLWVLPLPVLPFLLWLRRALLLRNRLRQSTKGHPNKRALSDWRWMMLLCRHGAAPPEEALIALAERARFSQHTLEPEDLVQIHQALLRNIQLLQEGVPLWKKLWQKYGLVLY